MLFTMTQDRHPSRMKASLQAAQASGFERLNYHPEFVALVLEKYTVPFVGNDVDYTSRPLL